HHGPERRSTERPEADAYRPADAQRDACAGYHAGLCAAGHSVLHPVPPAPRRCGRGNGGCSAIAGAPAIAEVGGVREEDSEKKKTWKKEGPFLSSTSFCSSFL